MTRNEQNNDIVIHDDEPDPMSMTEEKYFKTKEAYLEKVREQSKKMTQQNVIEFLRANWWKNNPNIKRENFDIFFGSIRETDSSEKHFPNCILVETAIVKKCQKPKKEDWSEMFVSKTGDRFGFAIIIN